MKLPKTPASLIGRPVWDYYQETDGSWTGEYYASGKKGEPDVAVFGCESEQDAVEELASAINELFGMRME